MLTCPVAPTAYTPVVGETREESRRTAVVLYGIGGLAWLFALVSARDLDLVSLLASVPDPWQAIVTAPFRPPVCMYLLAAASGFGMVLLVSEASERTRIYGALFAFTAPLYALTRLVATYWVNGGL